MISAVRKAPVGVLSREGEATVSEAEGVPLLVVDYRGIALPYLPGYLLCPERRFAQGALSSSTLA
jgi:hypothetical protein